MVSPARRRDAANYLVRRFNISERRACQLVEIHRSTKRYRPETPESEAIIVAAMNELAAMHPRWGYRSVAKLMRDQGLAVNVKRIERLWRQEGHRLPPRRLKESGQKARGVGQNSSKKLTGINVGAGAATGTAELVYKSKVEHIPIHLGDFVGVGLGALSGVTGNESQMKGWRNGFASMIKRTSNQKDVS
jgi:hypothetical protein